MSIPGFYGFLWVGLILFNCGYPKFVNWGNLLKVELVITNSRGKTEYVVTDTLKLFSLNKAIELASSGKLQNVYVVNGKRGAYLRSKPNKPSKDNLDSLSVTANQMWKAYRNVEYRLDRFPLDQFEEVKNANASLAKDLVMAPFWEDKDQDYTDWRPTKPKIDVVNHIVSHRKTIYEAAKQQKIDPILLGAILIDEYCRMGWLDDFDDNFAGIIGIPSTKWTEYVHEQLDNVAKKFSIGVAQIQIATARNIIQAGYYSPDKSINLADSQNKNRLIEYLDTPYYSIHFAAAYIRQIISRWKPHIDLSNRPDIIGVLYSQGYRKSPHPNPGTNGRGKNIQDSFYPMAKEILKAGN